MVNRKLYNAYMLKWMNPTPNSVELDVAFIQLGMHVFFRQLCYNLS